MEILARTCQAGAMPAKVAAVISNNPQAKGLVRAAEMGLQTAVVDHCAYADRIDFEAALAQQIDLFKPDLIILAGFMRVLGSEFVQRYENRIVNIHPSLLPSFTGLHTHRQALAAGVKIHGATVHFVTAELDHGPIVIQAAVPVYPDDTEVSLAARVLQQEHHIYPQAVRWFVEGRLSIQNGKVDILPREAQGLAW